MQITSPSPLTIVLMVEAMYKATVEATRYQSQNASSNPARDNEFFLVFCTVGLIRIYSPADNTIAIIPYWAGSIPFTSNKYCLVLRNV